MDVIEEVGLNLGNLCGKLMGIAICRAGWQGATMTIWAGLREEGVLGYGRYVA